MGSLLDQMIGNKRNEFFTIFSKEKLMNSIKLIINRKIDEFLVFHYLCIVKWKEMIDWFDSDI